jgi:hypothetical protein
MRRTTTLTIFLVLIATAISFAADIPDRPEKLKFPELTFDVPDADSLRFELADGTPVYAKQDTSSPPARRASRPSPARPGAPAVPESAPLRSSTKSSTSWPPISAPTSATSMAR